MGYTLQNSGFDNTTQRIKIIFIFKNKENKYLFRSNKLGVNPTLSPCSTTKMKKKNVKHIFFMMFSYKTKINDSDVLVRVFEWPSHPGTC